MRGEERQGGMEERERETERERQRERDGKSESRLSWTIYIWT